MKFIYFHVLVSYIFIATKCVFVWRVPGIIHNSRNNVGLVISLKLLHHIQHNIRIKALWTHINLEHTASHIEAYTK